jgi:dinuclear metal center YbgI/SA1388 family protein
VKIEQVLSALEQFAPLPLQESWDNAGLQIGLTEAEVSGALLCLDVTPEIVDEAIRRDCNVVVSHHPLLFRGLKQVADRNDVQRVVRKAIKNDICIISMHTNMDNARDGVNWKIAEKLELCDVDFFARKTVGDISCGSGVTGLLRQPLEAFPFIQRVKEIFNVECAQCNEVLQRLIRKVAICGGAGDFLLDEAIAEGADAFITGEMHYHQYFGHEQEIQICVIGHFQSEQFTTEVFRHIIQTKCPGVRCCMTETNTNPIVYI